MAAAIDARMDEVYWGCYRETAGEMRLAGVEAVQPPESSVLPDDASGLIAPEAMLDTRTHTVTAHTDQKTFTNREGQTVTRNKCVLDTPEGLAGDERRNWLLDHALTMEQAARGAMPALDITPEEASELRFGRRIERTISEPTAAIVPQTHDVAAIIERANAHQAKPVTVFPLA